MATLAQTLSIHRGRIRDQLERASKHDARTSLPTPERVDAASSLIDGLVWALSVSDGDRCARDEALRAAARDYARRLGAEPLRLVREYARLHLALVELAKEPTGIGADDLALLSDLLHSALVEALRVSAPAVRGERLLAELPVAVMLVSADDSISFANAAMHTLWGSARPLAGTRVDDRFRGVRVDDRAVLVGASFASPGTRAERDLTPGEAIEIDAFDGRRRTILVVAGAPLEDGGARLVVHVDVSNRAEVLRETQAAVRAREEVLGIVSHDLKNPIAAIQLAAQRLQRAGLDGPFAGEQVRAMAASILRSAARMHQLVTDLLDLSRIEGGQLRLERAPVPFAELVEDVLDPFRAQAAQKSIHVSVECAPPDATLVVDRDRFAQVLSNLVSNAIKFTPEGGAITLGARRHEGHCEVSVADTGEGIRAEDRSRIFEPFWQAAETAKRGTGLGLPIVRAMVEAHGGTIAVESEPDVGTTFRVRIPC